MAQRILICSASVGAGHGRAAEAIVRALTQLAPGAQVEHVDVLNLTNRIFRRIYGQGYFDAIALAPQFVKFVYELADRPSHWGDVVVNTIDRLNLRRFVDLLTRRPWDLVINTHFLPPMIVGHLREAGELHCPQMVVTTDFDVHRLWVAPRTEHYFTATEEGRVNLAAWNIPLERITASGIPIDPVFTEPRSVEQCRREHHLEGPEPVVLQLAGGAGFGPIAKVHQAILDVPRPLQIVSVCGRNEKLRKQLEDFPCPPRHRRTVMGFTTQIDELMAAADVIISKPGGLTTSESLARGACMIVFEPIPGQEERNCDYLLEQGAALKVNNLASLSFKLGELLNHPERLARMRAAAARAGRPQAAFDVAQAALALLSNGSAPPPQPPPRDDSTLSRLSFRRLRSGRKSDVAAPEV